jgi:hypothetical protein
MVSPRCPPFSRKRPDRCVAPSDATGHNRAPHRKKNRTRSLRRRGQTRTALYFADAQSGLRLLASALSMRSAYDAKDAAL